MIDHMLGYDKLVMRQMVQFTVWIPRPQLARRGNLATRVDEADHPRISDYLAPATTSVAKSR